jgi:hypothetical protein
MSVTLIAYPTATFIDDLTAWNNFNTRATADGADAVEAACFDCLYLRFAGLNAMPELAYVLDTMGGTDIAVTYSIGDIEDVTKQRGSFSKTITLPNTPTNRACFAYAYNIQSFVGGFQPNKRIRAAMWEDGVQVFSGVLQLLSMSKTKGTVTYEVGLFTDNVSLFKAIEGNMLVNTAGVTGMNHTPTSGHVSGTWTASGALSSGYVYGVVDAAGFSDVQQGGSFTVPWWRLGPSIYVKKMVDLIFTEAGFRYSSSFFNSSLFNKLVMPYAAGTPTTNLSGSNLFAQSTGSVSASLAGAAVNLEFSRDNVAPYFDNGGYWVASSSTFVAPAVPTRWNVSINYIVSGVTFGVDGVAGGDFDLYNTATSSPIALVGTVDLTSASYPLSGSVFFNNVTIPANAVVKFRYKETEGATSITFRSGATLQMTCLENPQSIGIIDMRTALPADVKQSDLLQDLQKMFNLQFMPDPQDPKLLYIEPWKDFYSSGSVVDWSQKSDENAEQNLTNGDPNAYTNIVFKYKDMGDYLSKTYKQSYPLNREGYGGRIFNTSNFYGKGDKVVETLCGTLIPASFSTDKIVGRTWDIDGTLASGTIKPLQTGYRLAQYNVVTAPTPWRYQYGVTGTLNTVLAVSQTALPFVSHIDNPYAPSVDLAFGQPRLVYYNAVNASGNPYAYTNNNLYNTYWLNYINETVSQEALQLELTMLLSSVDIYQLDFRKPVYYGGIRWRLLEIRDYLVGQMKPCRVTLRRILNLSEFAAKSTSPPRSDPSGLFNGPIDPDPVDPGYEPPVNPELPSEG